MPATVEEIRAALTEGRAIKRFIITDEAWYHRSATARRDDRITREITIGVDARDGGTYGEWEMNWRTLHGYGSAARLEMFDDGWAAFQVSGFADVMAQFADVGTVSVEEFTDALKAAGWTDKTNRRHP
jgi:hypothetical protein